MQNYVQKGDTITGSAGDVDIPAGGGALLGGSLFGVAVSDVAANASGEYLLTGVFDLAAQTSATFDVGDVVYFSATGLNCVSTASTNYPIGIALAAKASGDKTVRVRLNGIATKAES